MSSAAQVSQLPLATDRSIDAADDEDQAALQQRLASQRQRMGDLQRLARTVQLAFEGLAAVELDAERTLEEVKELIARLLNDSPWSGLQNLLNNGQLNPRLEQTLNIFGVAAATITSNAVNLLNAYVLQENGQDLYRNISRTIVAALRSALRDFDLAMQMMNNLVPAWAVTPQAQRQAALNNIMIHLDLAILMMQKCQDDCEKLLGRKRWLALGVFSGATLALLGLGLGLMYLAQRGQAPPVNEQRVPVPADAQRVPVPAVNRNVRLGVAGGFAAAAAGGFCRLSFITYKSLEYIQKIREHLKPGMASMKQLEDTAAVLKEDLQKLIADIQAATRNN